MANKEKILSVIEDLKKYASEEKEQSTTKVSAEDAFRSVFMDKAASAEHLNPEQIGQQIAANILETLEKEANKNEENDLNKIAGVKGVALVGSEPGIYPADPEDPQLGKTVTTTNEVEKGLVAKDKTAIVSSIIDQLTATRGMGPSVIVNETSQQMMPTPMGKQAELEKEAAEKQAGANLVLTNLFTKYAQVETQEEANAVYADLYKFAEAAEDKLIDNKVEGYDHSDIEKIASVMIENYLSDVQTEMQKRAEHEEAGRIMADSFLARLDEVGQANMQKEAAANEIVNSAINYLNQEVGEGNYTDEHIMKVAEFIASKQIDPADRVISKLG